MIKAIVCLGFLSTVAFVPTLGFSIAVVVVSPVSPLLVLLGVGD